MKPRFQLNPKCEVARLIKQQLNKKINQMEIITLIVQEQFPDRVGILRFILLIYFLKFSISTISYKKISNISNYFCYFKHRESPEIKQTDFSLTNSQLCHLHLNQVRLPPPEVRYLQHLMLQIQYKRILESVSEGTAATVPFVIPPSTVCSCSGSPTVAACQATQTTTRQQLCPLCVSFCHLI